MRYAFKGDDFAFFCSVRPRRSVLCHDQILSGDTVDCLPLANSRLQRLSERGANRTKALVPRPHTWWRKTRPVELAQSPIDPS